MRRALLILTAAAMVMTTAACADGDVVVMAQLEGHETGTQETTETVALSSLPVRLIPFDRDVIFDSLAQAYPEPEPEIPDSIADLQDRVVATQREWQSANVEWMEVRDSLQQLSDTLNVLDQSDAEYFVLFQDFGALEDRVVGLQERADAAFEEFEELQARLTRQSREIELARRNWEDEAFASVDSIFMARQEELGLEVRYDTTSAQGVARFEGVPEGNWWVNAWYDRPFDELYWNVPIEVTAGETTQMRLTEENAEVRQKL